MSATAFWAFGASGEAGHSRTSASYAFLALFHDPSASSEDAYANCSAAVSFFGPLSQPNHRGSLRDGFSSSSSLSNPGYASVA